jgi:PAS domain S-box-containing protein
MTLHSNMQTLADSLLNDIPVGIDMVDENGQVLYMNEYLQKLAGKNGLGTRCWQSYRDDKTQCGNCPLKKGIEINGVEVLETNGVFGGRSFQISHFGMIVQGRKVMLELFTDITERKRAEENFRESEERYRTLVEDISDIFFVSDARGKLLYGSPNLFTGTGYSSQDILGKSYLRLIAPADRRWVTDFYFEQVKAGARDAKCEFRGLRKDGSTAWVEQLTRFVRDRDGTLSGFRNVVRNISERKLAEETLAAERQLLQTLIDSLPDRIFVKDVKARFLLNNAEHLRALGARSQQEVLGKSDHDLRPPELADRYMADDQRVIQSGQPLHNREEQTILPSGERGWLLVSKVPLRDAEGKITGIVGISHDITKRKQAEQEIRVSEEKYRSLFEDSKDGVFESTPEGKFVSVNKAGIEILGYASKEEANAINIDRDLYVDQADRETMRNILSKEGFLKDYELLLKTKDGRRINVLLTTNAVRDGQGKVNAIRGIFRDITERKRTENALQESEFHLRESQAVASIGTYKTDFLRGRWESSEVLDEIFGIDREYNRTVQGWLDIVHPGDHEVMDRYLKEEVIAKRKKFDKEYRIIRKNDKQERWVHGIGKVEFDGNGNVLTMLGTIQDITERKKAETTLRQSEERFSKMFNTSPTPITLNRLSDGTFMAVNDSFLRLSGFTREEVIGHTAVELGVYPNPGTRSNFMKTLRELGRLPSFDQPFKGKSGKMADTLLSLELVTIDGEPCVLALALDITERKRAEEKLVRNEKRFRALIEHGKDIISLADRNGIITYTSPSNRIILGYSEEEFLGTSAMQYVHPEDLEALKIHYAETIKHPGMVVSTEFRHRHKDGSYRWLELIGANHLDDPNLEAMVATSRDITERKRSEEELKHQTSHFLQLFDKSPDAIVLLDTSDHIVDINKAFVTLFQYTLDEIKGRSLSDFIVPNEFETEASELSKESLSGQIVKLEVVRKRKDGRLVEVEVTGYPVEIENKIVGVYGIYQDVSEEKKLQEQLRQAQKMESIATLAGGVAHDFNNILGIVLGYIGVLQLRQQTAQGITEITNEIKKAVERGAALVRQLLTFARQTEAKIEPVDLNAVVLELTKMLNATFPKTVEIAVSGKGEIPLVKADASQLHQALLNLCVNARDAMPSGGTLSLNLEQVNGLSVREKFSEARGEKYIKIAVQDTGMGMDEATREHIFEPFFTTKGIGKGTGLGLAVVHGVVKGLHGFIDVQSTVGSGTAFSLYIPVPPQQLRTAAPEEYLIGEIPGGDETILLVEDEEALSFLLKSFLESKGYTVIVAKDGLEGVDSFRRQPQNIDLVFSDMGLPKLSGWEAAKRMREIRPEIKIVLASGFVDPNQRSEILKNGVHDIFQKPYVPNDVLKRIREILDSK